jgi:hypothetical protein
MGIRQSTGILILVAGTAPGVEIGKTSSLLQERKIQPRASELK